MHTVLLFGKFIKLSDKETNLGSNTPDIPKKVLIISIDNAKKIRTNINLFFYLANS